MKKEKEFLDIFMESRKKSNEVFDFDEVKPEEDDSKIPELCKNLQLANTKTHPLNDANAQISLSKPIKEANESIQPNNNPLIWASKAAKTTIIKFVTQMKEMSQLRKIPASFENELSFLGDNVLFRKNVRANMGSKGKNLNQLRIKIYLKKVFHNISKKHNFLIHPYNNFKIFWNVVQFFVMIFFFFFLPLDIIADFESSEIIRIWLSAFMVFDNLLGFRTAYFYHGKLITDRNKIFKTYILYFIWDLLTQMSLVYDIFLPDSAVNIQTKPIKLIFLIQYRKFLYIYQTLIERFRIDMKFGFLLDFLNLLSTSVCIMHWVACGWFAIGVYSGEKNTWLDLFLPKDKPFLEKYAYAFYWAAVTIMTVGYGDITPQNGIETLYATFIVVVGCGLFAYYIKYIYI